VISEILRKWFNLEPVVCPVCEVLRTQLDESNRERRELLNRALSPSQVESLPSEKTEELKPIGNTFIPWRVRQQMLEAEDRKKFQLMQEKEKEIADLEKELDLSMDPKKSLKTQTNAS